MKMRIYLRIRASVLLVPLAVLAVTASGCGGQGDKQLEGALSYLPADAPLVITVDTDVDGGQVQNLNRLARATPGWELIKRQLLSLVGLSEEVFVRDIKPWLGNEMVIGANSMSSLQKGKIVAVLETSNSEALGKFAGNRRESGFIPAGRYRDARLYTKFAGGLTVAVDGKAILISVNRKAIVRAIDSNRSGDAFDEKKIDAATGGDTSGLARVYLDVAQLVSDRRRSRTGPDLAKVAWLGSLTTLGATVQAGERDLTFNLKLKSGGKDLSPADIPIATGSSSPRLLAATGGYFSAGLRDLSQSIRFAEDVTRALDPGAYVRYEKAKQVIRGMFGVDIDQDVIEQLGGDTAIVAGPKGIGVKIDVRSSSRVQGSLGQTTPIIAAFIKAIGIARNPEIRHRIQKRTVIYEIRDGDRLLARYGVVNGILAVGVGKMSPFEIATVTVKGDRALTRRGALVFSIDVGRALDSALGTRVPPLIVRYLDFLRIRVTGSARATTKEVVARIKYSVG